MAMGRLGKEAVLGKLLTHIPGFYPILRLNYDGIEQPFPSDQFDKRAIDLGKL